MRGLGRPIASVSMLRLSDQSVDQKPANQSFTNRPTVARPLPPAAPRVGDPVPRAGPADQPAAQAAVVPPACQGELAHAGLVWLF